jgi:hypothetical protein
MIRFSISNEIHENICVWFAGWRINLDFGRYGVGGSEELCLTYEYPRLPKEFGIEFYQTMVTKDQRTADWQQQVELSMTLDHLDAALYQVYDQKENEDEDGYKPGFDTVSRKESTSADTLLC